MVKGVNKTIIEVNNTGSKLFEKIVFYVTPEYGNLSAKQLKKAATEFSFNYDSTSPKNTSLRKRYKKKRSLRTSAVIGLSLILIGLVWTVLALIL